MLSLASFHADEGFAGRGRVRVCDQWRDLVVLISPSRPVADNLAIDESLTRAASSDNRWTLRLWWGGSPTVVVGYSEKPEQVADLEACRRLGIEVVKRSTGGGTVLQTPEVLNYSLVGPSPATLDIRAIFRSGAQLLIDTLAELGLRGEPKGISDVAVGERKISGNAMARRWGGLLLHGTLLKDMDCDLLESCLRHPPREPDYRRGRGHREFITTLSDLGVAASREDMERAFLRAARIGRPNRYG